MLNEQYHFVKEPVRLQQIFLFCKRNLRRVVVRKPSKPEVNTNMYCKLLTSVEILNSL